MGWRGYAGESPTQAQGNVQRGWGAGVDWRGRTDPGTHCHPPTVEVRVPFWTIDTYAGGGSCAKPLQVQQPGMHISGPQARVHFFSVIIFSRESTESCTSPYRVLIDQSGLDVHKPHCVHVLRGRVERVDPSLVKDTPGYTWGTGACQGTGQGAGWGWGPESRGHGLGGVRWGWGRSVR